MHVRCPVRLPEEGYHRVLEMLDGFSPVVQALPPGAALVELRGAVGYFGMNECQIADVVRLRSVALLGVDLRIGIGTSWTVAATASGQVTGPGGVLPVTPESTEEWLATLPVEALHGIGPQHATALRRYGIDTVAQLAALPAGTVQRILGARAGRTASERARGQDPRPVTPRALPVSVSVGHRFGRDRLDGAEVRARLLELVVRLGITLRRRGQAARGVTLRLDFAGDARWEKSRRLREPSAHEDDLRTAAYQLMDAAGLQRGRLRGIVLKGEDAVGADAVVEQLSLDPGRETRLVTEEAADRVRDKFGPCVIGPAAAFLRVS
ncbi:DNA polymerase Y family protein [Streptomyces sp. B21-083]|uniref:DNA polymerase Y family protein n=1 Tax=Streptomyces sp. B21-083 TaxID=3039410 RepID=UPI002FF32459